LTDVSYKRGGGIDVDPFRDLSAEVTGELRSEEPPARVDRR
jgi:hypothetical protein